ncbi:MAG: ABC transporter substrate-binding protein [Calothrix sp. C42_A2020_038]|nr:ABC transporter substrate-binding protein [Calothrix sp. C42_A2020_038]
MSKVVVFTIGNGNFEQGFPVTLRIREEGGTVYKEELGQFPSAPDIPELYNNFQNNYHNLDAVRRVTRLGRGIDVDPEQTTNISTPDSCREAGRALEQRLMEWFEHPSMGQLRVYIEEEVGKDESARIIFQTNNEILKKLPWHLWKLFQNRKRAWLSLGAKYNPPSKPLQTPVKILAVLGVDDRIDVLVDGRVISNLPSSKVEALKQPTRKQLCDKLRTGNWDILCFAGHSATSSQGNDGVIQINNIDSPSLKDLRNAFIKAIENGLKLAIFNSCDGLGLASKLTELGIPQIIVMREPVPDEVAKEFLQEFLHLFSQGERFHLAMRKAQEKLEDIEHLYPYASWLPVVCQNPAESSLYWRQPLHIKIQRGIQKLWRSHKFATLATLVLLGICTAIIIGLIIHSPESITQKTPPSSNKNTPISLVNSPSIDKLFSRGDKILFTTNSAKERASREYGKNWQFVIDAYRESLKNVPNDPESLIYLNNAIAEATGKDNIHIAVSVPISKNLNVAERILRGVAHAQSKINCGSVDKIVKYINNNQNQTCTNGINGKLLEVEIVDDGNNHETTIEVARRLVNDKNQQDILAVIGHYRSELTITAVNNEYKDKILVVSPTSTSTQLSQLTYTVLRTVPSDISAVANMHQYISTKIPSANIRAIVAYHEGESYSQSIKDNFVKNINPLNVSSYNLQRDSVEQIISKVNTFNPNVILLVPSGVESVLNKALEIVKAIANLQDNRFIVLGSSTLYDDKTKNSTFGQACEKSKLLVSVTWHRNDSPFEKEANQLWGTTKINWVTVMSYDAVQVINKGLKTITGEPNRQKLKDNILNNIENFRAKGATAIIEFETQPEKGSRKPIRHDNRFGVLVKVECKNSSCDFIDERF